ncbi:SulP family inorganic anion transporter [Streptomyces sp. NPDC096319]|uniref:SulP family inorganic anion transporter n=1 Tax=Streptomyces sp. NPDC096319 TaxID=3366084 RepID=UPI0037F720C7
MRAGGRTSPRRPLPTLGWPRPADATAGAVTGLFSIPEGMAYAAIAGFNPVAGLYAGVVPAIVGSLTSRTVLMVTTLTSAIALTSQSVLSDAGLDPKDAGNVALLTVMVGAVMLLMGALRLGVVMSFVSNAVMTGFSTGIALQIITGVLKDATGYKPQGEIKLYQLGDWLVHVGDWQGAATAVAAATVAVWAAARSVRRLEPVALLLAMVVVSVGVFALSADVELVRDIADIPAALPSLTAPDLSVVPELVGGAFSVALVALAQAAGIAPSMPNPDGSRSDVNGDFRAQGYANLLGGLFQSLPSGGSMSRTGVAVSAGARTRWAGVFSGVFLALVVLVCGSLAERIPMPVIGGLILVVGGELVWGRRRDIVLVLRTSRLSSAAMVR